MSGGIMLRTRESFERVHAVLTRHVGEDAADAITYDLVNDFAQPVPRPPRNIANAPKWVQAYVAELEAERDHWRKIVDEGQLDARALWDQIFNVTLDLMDQHLGSDFGVREMPHEFIPSLEIRVGFIDDQNGGFRWKAEAGFWQIHGDDQFMHVFKMVEAEKGETEAQMLMRLLELMLGDVIA